MKGLEARGYRRPGPSHGRAMPDDGRMLAAVAMTKVFDPPNDRLRFSQRAPYIMRPYQQWCRNFRRSAQRSAKGMGPKRRGSSFANGTMFPSPDPSLATSL